MDDSTLSPLARLFRRHLRAENRATSTIETYLAGIRQAERYLKSRGKELVTADRADLEAFIGDLLSRRAASTAWT
jgi:site-specific recombinase XerD